MRTEKHATRKSAIAILLSGAIVIAPCILPSVALAGKSNVLHSFGGSDGWLPESGVIRGPDGTLFGTALQGGADVGPCAVNGCGTVYKITPQGEEVTLHQFTPPETFGPASEPALDSMGNLYGSTCCGGKGSYDGAIYKLAPDGTYTELHDFTGKSDGASPFGVAVDSTGNVFGTASVGGANSDGVLYEITAQGKFQVLHTFAGGADGSFPTGTPMVDEVGDIYGTTQLGGGDCGTVFKVTPRGKETILHSFSGVDGCYPYAGVVRDSVGNFYVTTYEGGAYNSGTLVRLSPSGRATVLHSFGAPGDGYGLYSPPTLVVNKKGKVEVYGLTTNGGGHGAGIAYKFSSEGRYKVEYRFGDGSSDSYGPAGMLATSFDGTFYGASSYGGANCPSYGGCGTVFELRAH